MIAVFGVLAAAQIALSAEVRIAVGETISEKTQLAIDQLKKCGTSAEAISSCDGKSSAVRITRMYYSTDANVLVEVVTLDGTVEKLMWQRYNPDGSSFGDVEFAAAREILLKGKQFSATTTKVDTKKQKADHALQRVIGSNPN